MTTGCRLLSAHNHLQRYRGSYCRRHTVLRIVSSSFAAVAVSKLVCYLMFNLFHLASQPVFIPEVTVEEEIHEEVVVERVEKKQEATV